MNTRIGYDGDVYYTIVLNSFVHFVMYGYYQLTTLNIPVPKTIKMLVTKLQMFQFVTMNGQAIYLLTMGCEYPRTLTYIYFIYILSLLVLFQDFSNKTYKDSKSTTAAGAKKSKEESKKRK
jgi:elongation of very long chain fatty acids protein 4